MAETTPPARSSKKPSSVRHTRAIQRDRSKRPPVAPPDPVVAARLAELIHPATLAQLDHFRALGLRARVLTLPVSGPGRVEAPRPALRLMDSISRPAIRPPER